MGGWGWGAQEQLASRMHWGLAVHCTTGTPSPADCYLLSWVCDKVVGAGQLQVLGVRGSG